MKNTHLLFQLFLSFLIFCTVACGGQQSGQPEQTTAAPAAAPTTVYLVRHAEKDLSDPKDEDPGLTPAGEARAEALRALLEGQEVDALYATKYIRTKNTLKPLADARQLEVQEYEAQDFGGLKEQVLQQHPGQTVVVAGHSNTVLPLIEAFGATRPVAEIADSTYDYLFKVTVPASGGATVETSRFGAPGN